MEQREAKLEQRPRRATGSVNARRDGEELPSCKQSFTEVAVPAAAPPPAATSCTPMSLRTAAASPTPAAAGGPASRVAAPQATPARESRSAAAPGASGALAPQTAATGWPAAGASLPGAEAKSGGDEAATGSLLQSCTSPVMDQRLLVLAREVVDVDAGRRRRALKKIENFFRPLPLSAAALIPLRLFSSSSQPPSLSSRAGSASSHVPPASGGALGRPAAASPAASSPSTAVASSASSQSVSSAAGAARASSASAACVARGTRPILSLQQFERVWVMLFYAAWLSDKPLVQRELFVRLALLQRLLQAPEEKRRFFKAFFLVMQRQWHALDQHRLDKFLLLVRIITAELTAALLASCRCYSGEITLPATASVDNSASTSSTSESSSDAGNSRSSRNNSEGSQQQMQKASVAKKNRGSGSQLPLPASVEEQHTTEGAAVSLKKIVKKMFLSPMAKFFATELLVGSQEQHGAARGLRLQFIECFLAELRASAGASSVTGGGAARVAAVVVCADDGAGGVTASRRERDVQKEAGDAQQQEQQESKSKEEEVEHQQPAKEQQQEESCNSSSTSDVPILRFVLFPFLYAACYCSDSVSLKAVHQRVLRELEPRDVDFRTLVMTLFSLASTSGIRAENRRLLYSTVNELEKKVSRHERRQQQKGQQPQKNAAGAAPGGEACLPAITSSESLQTQACSAAVEQVVAAIVSLHSTTSSSVSSNRGSESSRNTDNSSGTSNEISGDVPSTAPRGSSPLLASRKKIRTWQEQASGGTTKAPAEGGDGGAGAATETGEKAEAGRLAGAGTVSGSKGEEKEKQQLKDNEPRCAAAENDVLVSEHRRQQQEKPQEQEQWEQQQKLKQKSRRLKKPSRHHHSQQKRETSVCEPVKKKVRPGVGEETPAALDDDEDPAAQRPTVCTKIRPCVRSVKKKALAHSVQRRAASAPAATAVCQAAPASPASATASQAAAVAGGAGKRRRSSGVAQTRGRTVTGGASTAENPGEVGGEGSPVATGCNPKHVKDQTKHAKGVVLREGRRQHQDRAQEPLRDEQQQHELQQRERQQLPLQEQRQEQLSLQQAVQQQQLTQDERQPQQQQSQQHERQQPQQQHQRQRLQGEQQTVGELPHETLTAEQGNNSVVEESGRTQTVSAGETLGAGPARAAGRVAELSLPVKRKDEGASYAAEDTPAAVATPELQSGSRRAQAASHGNTISSTSSSESSPSSSYSRQSSGASTSSNRAKKGAAEGTSSRRVCFDLKKNRIAAFHWLQPPSAVGPALSSVESQPAASSRKNIPGVTEDPVHESAAEAAGGVRSPAILLRSSESSAASGTGSAAAKVCSTKEVGASDAAADADALGANRTQGTSWSVDLSRSSSSLLAASGPTHPAAGGAVVATSAVTAGDPSPGSEAAAGHAGGGGPASAGDSEHSGLRNEVSARATPTPRVLKSILKKRQQKFCPAPPSNDTESNESSVASTSPAAGSTTEAPSNEDFGIRRFNLNRRRPRCRSGSSGPVLALPDGSLHDSSPTATESVVHVTPPAAQDTATERDDA